MRGGHYLPTRTRFLQQPAIFGGGLFPNLQLHTEPIFAICIEFELISLPSAQSCCYMPVLRPKGRVSLICQRLHQRFLGVEVELDVGFGGQVVWQVE